MTDLYEANPALARAIAEWVEVDEASGDVANAVHALGLVVAEIAWNSAEEKEVVVAAAALLSLYAEFEGDPDGEATERFYTAIQAIGFSFGGE